MEEIQKERRYVAITHEQHPLTGSGIPVVLELTGETTLEEIIAWYRSVHPKAATINDLGIIEVDQD